MISLSLLPLPLSNLRRETALDSRNGSSTAAAVASDETETILALAELCVRALASLADDVVDDVSSQNTM